MNDCEPLPKYQVGDVVRFTLDPAFPGDTARIVVEATRSQSPDETDWYYLASNQYADGFVLGEQEIIEKLSD